MVFSTVFLAGTRLEDAIKEEELSEEALLETEEGTIELEEALEGAWLDEDSCFEALEDVLNEVTEHPANAATLKTKSSPNVVLSRVFLRKYQTKSKCKKPREE